MTASIYKKKKRCRHLDRCLVLLNSTTDQTFHDVSVIDGLQMKMSKKEKIGRESQRKKMCATISPSIKKMSDFLEKNQVSSPQLFSR